MAIERVRRVYQSVLEARENAFEVHSKLIEYATGRGLSSYENELPRWNGMSFIDIVEKKIKEAQEDERVRIVDIGCGNGSFLVSCARRWPDRVSCIGITAQEYPNKFLEEQRLADSAGELQDGKLAPIEIVRADVLNIDSLVGHGNADVVVALQSFRYLADPWMTLKKVYSVLKDDGVCLIDSINFNLRHSNDPNDQDRIMEEVIMADYLRNGYGMEFFAAGELHPLSFKKTLPRLILPLHYAGKMETDELEAALVLGEKGERYDVVQYELDRKKASKYVWFAEKV